MPLEFSYIADSVAVYRQYKTMAERAMAQVSDEQLNVAIDPESNSIALIVKHVAGNLRSRWTDFLTADGEKPDRNRDAEFEQPFATRDDMRRAWELGWQRLFDALEPLTDSDLSRTVKIRDEALSVMQAINRNLAHTASHVGQIVFLAKHFQSANWQSLSIPKRRA